jgi:predicted transcriptional regulator
MTTKAKKTPLIKDYRKLRSKMNLNQSEFWNRVGATQSAGSRYETGRTVPKSVAVLAHQAYIKGDPVDVREFK